MESEIVGIRKFSHLLKFQVEEILHKIINSWHQEIVSTFEIAGAGNIT